MFLGNGVVSMIMNVRAKSNDDVCALMISCDECVLCDYVF